MGKICKFLGWTIEVLGVIGSYNLAKTLGEVSKSYSFYSYDDRDWVLTISIFLGGVLVTSALAFILLGIAAVLDRMDTVEYMVSDLRHQADKPSVKNEGGLNTWKCPVCGKNNPLYTGTCSCGQDRV